MTDKWSEELIALVTAHINTFHKFKNCIEICLVHLAGSRLSSYKDDLAALQAFKDAAYLSLENLSRYLIFTELEMWSAHPLLNCDLLQNNLGKLVYEKGII